MITISHKGDFNATERFLEKIKELKFEKYLKSVGEQGVMALAEATPKRSGKTAASWTYEIVKTPNGSTVQWANTNVNKGENIALLIQFGHGTRRGGYVRGVDYINPALRPVLDKFVEEITQEVMKT